MPSFDIPDIAKATQARILTQTPEETRVMRFLFDSRKLSLAGGTMFVAIPGKHQDGHDYVVALYHRGVRSFLVSRPIYLPGPANVLLADNSLAALQRLAARHRERFPGKVIGISGSNGKTIVKEWLFQILSAGHIVYRSPQSYNSQLGVALSLLQLEPYHSLALIEAGISQPGEMEKLAQMIQPDLGVFTFLGPAHDAHFLSRQQKLEEKMLLFQNAQSIVFPKEISAISDFLERTHWKSEAIAWGEGGLIQLLRSQRKGEGTMMEISFPAGSKEILLPFRDQASVWNAMSVACLLTRMGYDPDFIASGLQNLQPLEMRLELKEGINACTLINDSYSSDLMSLQVALDFMDQQDEPRERVLILSDILQSGLPPESLYATLGEQLRARKLDRLIGIGKEISAHRHFFQLPSDFYPDTETFIREHPLSSFRQCLILLKGARPFVFERIVQMLQQKAHETILQINLSALTHNLKFYQSILPPGTRTMAMIKAFGYGSGSWEIARLLQFHKVDYLGVAYVDEGYALRKAGIQSPIMVMNPDSESLLPALRYGLEPEIYSKGILEELISGVMGAVGLSKPVQIHLKIDSGMHRLGFLPEEVPHLISRLQKHPEIRVASVFTHLAASEDPAEDAFTHQQAQVFLDACSRIEAGLGYPFIRHLLNSAGVSRFPEYHLDMVRLGIGLYGVAGTPDQQEYLENVSTLRSVISQIKHIRKGESVGYNRKWVAEENTRIAIVPVGYADGYDMRLGNGLGRVLIRGNVVPVIGKVCMDMIMVHLGGLEAEEGEEVILFGEGLPVGELAAAIGTIPYEILTGISARVKRVYYYA